MTALLPILAAIIVMGLDVSHGAAKARNASRQTAISLIAEAIHSYTLTEGPSLLQTFPAAPVSRELCADTQTGSCSTLASLMVLVPTYLESVPTDPNSEDTDLINEHSNYFVQRSSGNHFTITAPDAELNVLIEVRR